MGRFAQADAIMDGMVTLLTAGLTDTPKVLKRWGVVSPKPEVFLERYSTANPDVGGEGRVIRAAVVSPKAPWADSQLLSASVGVHRIRDTYRFRVMVFREGLDTDDAYEAGMRVTCEAADTLEKARSLAGDIRLFGIPVVGITQFDWGQLAGKGVWTGEVSYTVMVDREVTSTA